MTPNPGVHALAPPRPAGTAAIGAVMHLPATATEEGRDLSSMSGIPFGTTYRLLPV
ncbi:hypothetical protein OHA61_38765 [Streptomyces sp. NBC_00885]|uniref:hypothetical protein n=1 Tax=Streptomyces sp. NBC_00885 TaxID=2975857 RepID=UPI00386C7DC7|nr:hypothetical protein OHA61_38765 [Streptomyces sp. NBC_00885]